jgi:NO-binding membrane sensor protein with MHYT domain
VHHTYNAWLVSLSVVVAMVVSYTALRLAARVAESHGAVGRSWLLGGALAMGSGVWSMHFIGMLAFSVGTPLRYSVSITLASLAIAIATSGFALVIASRSHLSLQRLSGGALVMGAGIGAMHYTGMAAIMIEPAISYDPALVAVSIAIAVTASFAALWLAFNLRSGQSWLTTVARGIAAVIMGLAISGMHYTAMHAAQFMPGSHGLGGMALDNNWLAVTIGITALGVLALTLITAVYDGLSARIRQDALQLAQVNADLQYGKNLLALATHAAGISLWELDLKNGTTLWTENEIESLRVAGVDTRTSPEAIAAMTHPDDAAVLSDAVRKAVADGKDVCAYRFRVVTPLGNAVHLQANARIYCDERNEPVRVLGVSWDVTNDVLHEERQRELHAQLREASRAAGMAEVATGVLHNVGNVLNSLGVSVSVVRSQLRESRVRDVQRVASLLLEQGDEITKFLESDGRGKLALNFLAQLGEHLAAENGNLQTEAAAIADHVQHICTIVAAQQTHARRSGVTEPVDIAELMDSAIAIHFAASVDVSIRRDYEPVPPITLDRHKLIQILGNLLTNACDALKERNGGARELTVGIHSRVPSELVVQVRDSGVGIEPAALQRIFEFGFTTKKHGHGFGLHASANLAKELGGELTVHSDGPGRGAEFALRLPYDAAAGGDVQLRKQA